MNKEEDLKLTVSGIYSALFSSYKPEIILISLFYAVNSLLRLAFTILLQILFESVERGEINNAYMFGVFTAITLYLYHITLHNSFYEAQIFTSMVRSGLASLIFKKIYGFTQFNANKSELGKITNLLSNDFNMI